MQYKQKKAVQAFNYIAENNNGVVDKLQAVKLIWFADRLHLRKYGRTITGDKYCAMPYGPVPSISLDLLNHNHITAEHYRLDFGYADSFIQLDGVHVKSLRPANLRVFSKTDVEVLNLVLSKYNHIDGFHLADISHEFPEWNRFENDLKDPKKANSYPMDLDDFFVDVPKYELFSNEDDLITITKDLFFERKAFQDVL